MNPDRAFYRYGRKALFSVVCPNGEVLLIILLSIQAFFLLLVYLDSLQIGIFQLQIGFAIIVTTLMPGLLLLSLIPASPTAISERIVHAVGVSLVVVMIAGALISYIYPHFGISRPLTPISLSITIASINIFLILLNWTQGTPPILPSDTASTLRKVSPPIFLIGFLPLFAVFGAHMTNQYNINSITIYTFTLISILPIFALKKLPEKSYPFLIWSISLSLLLGNNLIYNYLGAAIEYNDVLPVYLSGHWSLSMNIHRIPNLRLMVLHPAQAVMAGVPLHISFKLIHPIIFSPMPVALYLAYKKQFSNNVALLGSFLFMFMQTFYVNIPEDTRNGAVFYMALLLLLIVDDTIKKELRGSLLVIYTLGLISYHYGAAHLFLFIAITILAARATITILGKFESLRSIQRLTSPWFYVLFIVVLLFWDIYITNNRFFELIMSGFSLAQSIIRIDVVSTQTDAAVSLFSQRSFATSVVRNVYVVLSVLISIGTIRFGVDYLRTRKCNLDYVASAFCVTGFLALSVSPAFLNYGIRRLFMLSAVFIAPLSIVGLQTIIELIKFPLLGLLGQGLTKSKLSLPKNIPIKAFSALLLVLLLFSSGVISAMVTHDRSTNVIVDEERIINEGTPPELYSLLQRELTDHSYSSSHWIVYYSPDGSIIYKTGLPTGNKFALRAPLTQPRYAKTAQTTYSLRPLSGEVRSNDDIWTRGDYVYVGEFTLLSGEVILYRDFNYDAGYIRRPRADVSILRLGQKNRIYDNGRSSTYWID